MYVDRLTGWPCIVRTGRSTSSHDVIVQLRRLFSDVGVPSKLVTDGGPQFSSHKFAKFCERWGVRHQMSSPHYPQSNGHAEASVKAMKSLIAKTTMNGDLDMDAFRTRQQPHDTGEYRRSVVLYCGNAQTPREECGSLLRQRPNTKSWSAIIQRTEMTKRTSSSKQNFQVSNQNAHFSEPYNSGTAGQ